jgi:hypothetical protein
MSSIYSESAAHRATIAAAEGAKQVAISAAGNSQSAVNAAVLTYARGLLQKRACKQLRHGCVDLAHEVGRGRSGIRRDWAAALPFNNLGVAA